MNFGRLLTLFCACLLLSCSKPPAKVEVHKPTEASEKLIEIARSEHNLKIKTWALDNTLWIYVPLEEAFFDIEANDEGPKKSKESKELFNINYLQGLAKDNNFIIEYDIRRGVTYATSYGYSSKYTETFQAVNRNVITAVGRVYASAVKSEEDGHFYLKYENDLTSYKAPDFFVIVIADIKTGIESKITFYLGDVKRGMVDQTFYEEYVKRLVIENPIGHTPIKGDKEGNYIKLADLTWPEFLADQMVYRINFKYTRSDFPPSEDTLGELKKLVAETINAYDYKDYTSVRLHDLSSATTVELTKDEIAQMKNAAPGGKLHVIEFK